MTLTPFVPPGLSWLVFDRFVNQRLITGGPTTPHSAALRPTRRGHLRAKKHQKVVRESSINNGLVTKLLELLLNRVMKRRRELRHKQPDQAFSWINPEESIGSTTPPKGAL